MAHKKLTITSDPNVIQRAYKYRIYPTAEQAVLIRRTIGCVRKVWNLMLEDCKMMWSKYHTISTLTPAYFKTAFPYLKEVDSLALTSAWMDLRQAYKNHRKNPKHFNAPKFKSRKHSHRSYRTNNLPNCNNIRLDVENSKIRLPKLGWVKIVLHRLPDEDMVIKSVTVSQDTDGKYYASVLCEMPKPAVTEKTVTEDTAIGFDYASHGLYVASDGSKADMPDFYRKSEKKLIRAQRKLSRRTMDSKNYYKQKHIVAKINCKIKHQRTDFLHKKSTEIANQYSFVGIEDLNMKAIANHKHHLGKSTYGNGWGEFTAMLAYKLSDRGGHLVKVDKFYPSSQTCHVCGYRNPDTKKLEVRTWTCPVCGTHHDRDINAAINIKTEALRVYHTT